MDEQKVYLPTREEWRSWLLENYDSMQEIWLIYYKKHTGKASIPYNDAVEEALCFGWIDSLVRRIDGERYMQKYTPRKPKSTWSKHNVRRIEKMISEGKMQPPGIKLFEFAKENGLLPDMSEEGRKEAKLLFPEAPQFFIKALNENPKANSNFNSLAPSYKLQFLGWIMDAKKKETQHRRLKEAIELLNSGKKLGMK